MRHWNIFDKSNRAYIDGLSRSLWESLNFKPDQGERDEAGWTPEKYVTGSISGSQISGTIIVQEPDPITLEIVRIKFLGKEGSYELVGESLDVFDELCGEISEKACTDVCVDEEAIKENVLAWIVKSIDLGEAVSLFEFLSAAIGAEVGDQEIWVQIGGIDVERSFKFGNGEIIGIDEGMIDAWIDIVRFKGLDKRSICAYEKYLKASWQGTTAAVSRARGCASSVERQAIEFSEIACGLLRLLEPTNPSIIQRSYLEPIVELSNAGQRRVLVNPGSELGESSEVLGNSPTNLTISSDNFKEAWVSAGLCSLHSLLATEQLSDFQSRLLKAILIFTRHRIVSEPVEKLVLAFAGLESLLLGGNEKVPIRSTLKRRFASALSFAGGGVGNPSGCLNTAYNIRSEFLHHGLSLTQRKSASEFLFGSWIYFKWAVANHYHWKSIDEHCRFLD